MAFVSSLPSGSFLRTFANNSFQSCSRIARNPFRPYSHSVTPHFPPSFRTAARPPARCTIMTPSGTGVTANDDITRLRDTERFSLGVVYNGTLTTSGLLAPVGASDNVTGQTEAILRQVDEILAESGSDKSRILSVTIWLVKEEYIQAFNAVWDNWLDVDNKPVRACVVSKLVRPDALVEIQVNAAVAPSSASRSRAIATSRAAAAVGPYNQAIAVDDGTVYVSGCIGLTADTGVLAGDDVEAQTEQALRNLRAILDEAGCAAGDIVKVTILLDDMGDFATVNRMYEAFFEGGRVPARSCFAAKQLPKGALVEIEAVAVGSK